jgi:hypothetical protein
MRQCGYSIRWDCDMSTRVCFDELIPATRCAGSSVTLLPSELQERSLSDNRALRA